MATAPIYLGDNRSLVTFQTGEIVCVDTGSIDAIRYLTGVAETSRDLQLFRRLLKPRSTVIDVGANFGMFTAVAAKMVRSSGRLFSIEPNPRTFECLRRTVFANFADNSRVVLLNAAAFDRPGKLSLRFLPDELGGATVVGDIGRGQIQHHEIDGIVLDDFLPADLPVDLVKIDVEGAEAAVLRGMEGIIRRSPNIAIIMEYIEGFVAQSIRPDRMLEYIRSLGLAVCFIGAEAKVEVIAPGQMPPENDCYLLLTRTPERANEISISPHDLSYPDACMVEGRNALLQAQTVSYSRRTGDVHGIDLLFYGPYIEVPSGAYELRFHGTIAGSAVVRLTHDFGKVICECPVSDFGPPIAIDLPEDVKNFEVLLFATSGLDSVQLRYMSLRRR